MKKSLIILIFGLFTLCGCEKMERVDCLRHLEHCEKYADAGACEYVPAYCWKYSE